MTRFANWILSYFRSVEWDYYYNGKMFVMRRWCNRDYEIRPMTSVEERGLMAWQSVK